MKEAKKCRMRHRGMDTDYIKIFTNPSYFDRNQTSA
jgi:hypothetical protein